MNEADISQTMTAIDQTLANLTAIMEKIAAAAPPPAKESPLRTSARTELLDEAMAKAQAKVKNPSKGLIATVTPKAKEGQASAKPYTYQYASMDIVLDAARPIYGGEGIAVYQVTRLMQNGDMLLCTRFSFQGQWIEMDYPVGNSNAPHQTLGSALTYARRYSYCTLANIMPESEDDDGQTAAPAASRREPPPQQQARMADTAPKGAVKNASQSKKDGDWALLTGGMKAQRTEEELLLWAKDRANRDVRARMPSHHRRELDEFFLGQLERVQKADADRALDRSYDPHTGEIREPEGEEGEDGDTNDDDIFPGDRPPTGSYAAASGR